MRETSQENRARLPRGEYVESTELVNDQYSARWQYLDIEGLRNRLLYELGVEIRRERSGNPYQRHEQP